MWKSIKLNKNCLNLNYTLCCGQCFRWKFLENEESSLGVFAGRLWLIKVVDESLLFQVFQKKKEKILSDEQYMNIIANYFRLNIDLSALYLSWSSDSYFSNISQSFSGIRQLHQDPFETLISFILSACNNIQRISQMIEKVCIEYGEYITSYNNISYYDFPKVEKLIGAAAEARMRQLGFGYRARYVRATAERLIELGGSDWLLNLRILPYEEVVSLLVHEFPGVGRKVADCVALMSLDKLEAVPLDTHMMQLAVRIGAPSMTKAATSLNKKAYENLSLWLRQRWLPYSGWAQTVFFVSELNKNKNKSQIDVALSRASIVGCKRKGGSSSVILTKKEKKANS